MSIINRAIDGLHKHCHYIGIGGAATFVIGAALSSLILKVVGVSLGIIALLGYLHQKFFTSPPPSLRLANTYFSTFQQVKPPVKPEIQQPVEIVPSYEAGNATHITDSITSEEQIHTLASINGLSIHEIEERARPENVENNGMSYSGFLGIEESFKEVLLSDWKTVRALGSDP